MSLLKKLLNKYNSLFIQAGKFITVGALNTLLDFGGFSLLFWFFGLNKYLSQTISFGLSVLNSYIFNRIWTFKAKNIEKQTSILKMYVVNGTAFFLTLGGLKFFSDLFGMHELLAKILTAIPITIFNFLSTKFWVFSEKKRRIFNK